LKPLIVWFLRYVLALQARKNAADDICGKGFVAGERSFNASKLLKTDFNIYMYQLATKKHRLWAVLLSLK